MGNCKSINDIPEENVNCRNSYVINSLTHGRLGNENYDFIDQIQTNQNEFTIIEIDENKIANLGKQFCCDNDELQCAFTLNKLGLSDDLI